MSIATWSFYSKADANVLGGEVAGDSFAVDFLSDTIKALLTTSAHTVNLDTHETLRPERGNILTWEQYLKDRRLGTPLVMEMTMERNSILYRTLLLFAGALVTALAVMGGLIAWTMRRGKRAA